MTTGAAVEQTSQAEGQLQQVKAHIVDSLRAGPNISPSLNEATGNIIVAPRSIISSGKFGVRQNESGIDNASIDDESRRGGETVTVLAEIVKGNLGPDNLFDSQITAGLTLETQRSGYVRGLILNSPRVRGLIGIATDGKPSHINSEGHTFESAAQKGLPPEATELAALATASWLGKKIDTVLTKEAENIDAKQTVLPLEANVTRLEKEEIPRLETQIPGQEATATTAREAERETRGPKEQVDGEIEVITKHIEETCDKTPEDKRRKLVEAIIPHISILKETGFIFKGAKVDESELPALDAALTDAIQDGPEISELLQTFGLSSSANILRRVADERITQYLDMHPSLETIRIFDEVKDLFRSAPELKYAIDVQENLLVKLQTKSPDAARKAVIHLAKSGLMFHLLRHGLNREAAGDHIANRNFRRDVQQVLNQTQKSRTIQEAWQEASRSRSHADSTLRGTQDALAIAQNSLAEDRKKLDALAERKGSRINKLKTSMLVKILPDSQGREAKPTENIQASLSMILESQLFADTLQAVIQGLPHFVANDNRHPNAAQAVWNNLGQRGDRDAIAKLHDYLPDIVDAMIPDHPNRTLAVELLSDMLRQYSLDPNVRSSAGYTDRQEPRMRGQALGVCREIVAGGRITEVPKDIPRVNLEKIRALRWEGPEAESMLQASHDPLLQFIQSLDLTDYDLVPHFKLTHPEHDSGQIGTFATDQESFVQSANRAISDLAFFNVPPYNEPVYVIERKTPRRNY